MKCRRSSPATGGNGRFLTAAARSRNRLINASVSSVSAMGIEGIGWPVAGLRRGASTGGAGGATAGPDAEADRHRPGRDAGRDRRGRPGRRGRLDRRRSGAADVSVAAATTRARGDRWCRLLRR